ncbi:peptide/nickel transport system substrate-binding protein [Enhydrobacter aerosaccus]|uniref:Peptide/nickel transport system substrate-binding protein n=1 Tax=Enhydrobacter aerosaccus TaxID=225324 RepID=A0A1T4SZ35_9HYPH|nr:ABC transporter substrate-binding protein [Enhydrobacter aerosaccus]SKA33493.1 peptide/nickel transport system substrate-binding protein [Enhydrobacter aerosaccus]
MKLTRRSALLAATSLAVAPSAARADKAADTLRILFLDAVPNIDMYFNNQRTGLILAHHAWDMLVHRDPGTFEIKPSLATEWKFTDDTTLDLTIRQGVKFHDGSPLTAEDVVYTINIAADPMSKVATPSNYAWIDKAEKTGDFSVRIKMKRPTPAALEYLAMVTPINPKAYREKVGPEGFAAKPIGAGPYKIVKNDQGKEVIYERFEEYWAGSPKGKPAIKNLHVRFVPDLATEVTELIGRRADWIWNVNPDQMDNINKIPFLQSVRQESMRVGYLSIDAAGRSGAGNPLTNVKVRQAIWHAVNRKEIADKLVGGGSRVPPAPCFPSQFGCDADAAVKYDYDPAKAKALLAEAGFPNGFETEMLSYVQPTSWGAAIQNYLAAVGIKAKINQLQVAPAIQKAWKGEAPLYFASWGSYSINDVSAILPVMFGKDSLDNYSRDPELEKLIAEGGSTSDKAVRSKDYSAAIKIATEKAYWMPVATYVNTYAFAKDLDFKTYPDELPRFYLAKWK